MIDCETILVSNVDQEMRFDENRKNSLMFKGIEWKFVASMRQSHSKYKSDWLRESKIAHQIVAKIMSQTQDDILRSVAYFSKKMNSIECNYMIYDKEL
jgi:hypothetical protein